MKKNNGFTLIELIAVITLLAAIILVSVPVMINTISKTEQKEYEDFEKLVINAAELYLERNRDLYPDFNQIGDGIDITLETLINEGYLKSDIEVPYDNKDILKYKISVIIEQNEILYYKLVEIKTFSELSTMSTEVTSIPACVTNGIKCETGVPVAIKVNEKDVYNFYVISDDGNKVELIMNRNLYSSSSINNGNVAWISASDYENANTDDNTNCEHDSCTDEGPLTAISVLKERTTYWTNIPEIEYTYSDDGGGNKYTSFTETMRSKMITYTEVNNIISANGGTLPEWMYINLKNTGDNNTTGYWLSAARSSSPVTSHRIRNVGDLFYDWAYVEVSNGIRPVITLYKSL